MFTQNVSSFRRGGGPNLLFYLFLQKVYFLMVLGDYNFLETGFPCVPVLVVLELVL